MNQAILATSLPFPVRRGKARDIYMVGDDLLMVSTDRISAFDWVLPNGIPDKGRVLNSISDFWFPLLYSRHHCLTTDIDKIPQLQSLENQHRETLRGRTMLVKKCTVVPIECVVRGFLDGSGWKEYQQSGIVCGIALPPGLLQGSQLETPLFTPATKEESGHDINISFERMVEIVGHDVADELRSRSIVVYNIGAAYARERGIIIADTKFEWGWFDGELILIDEVLTPDSSRFWPLDQYEPGHGQPSFDKQFVRDWLVATGWNKNSPPPELPPDIIEQTRAKYIDAFQILSGQEFPWK